jgi:hypothetical protein
LILVAALSGCASHTEARIRHYFGMSPSEPLTSTNIQSNLLLQFPIGTSSATVEATLQRRGIGKDGKSAIWRPETNEWRTANTLCCGPYDYEEFLLSSFPMRRLQVCFDLDAQSNVKASKYQVTCMTS